MQHPGVADVAVIGMPDEKWGETGKAILVRAEGKQPYDREVIEFCRERLAHYKCLTSIDWCDTLPRTPSGKSPEGRIARSLPDRDGQTGKAGKMTAKHVSIERDGRVAVVRFDRGDGKNALSFDVLRELTEAAHSFEEDSEISAIVLTGTPSVFTMGLRSQGSRDDGAGDAGSRGEAQAAADRPPVVSRLGKARAHDHRRARGLVRRRRHVDRGVLRSAGGGRGGCQLRAGNRARHEHELADRAPHGRARRAGADQAVVRHGRATERENRARWGYFDAVAPDGSALERALEMAHQIAAMPPVQVRMVNRASTRRRSRLPTRSARSIAISTCWPRAPEDYEEGSRSFLEKRAPEIHRALNRIPNFGMIPDCRSVLIYWMRSAAWPERLLWGGWTREKTRRLPWRRMPSIFAI